MFNIFKKLFPSAGSLRQPSRNSSLPNSRIHQHSMLQDGSETATRGQLVQIMMRDLVRKSGIPPSWIHCQIQVVTSRTRGQGIFVRLVVKHWDERLMKYAFAFQKALLTEIVEFEPEASSWLQGIAWQLEVAGSCPVTKLPESQFWQAGGSARPFDSMPRPVSAMPVSAAAVPTFALDALETPPSAVDKPSTLENDTAEDLERLFAIRDRELEQLATSNLLPAGYEKTEPSPLA